MTELYLNYQTQDGTEVPLKIIVDVDEGDGSVGLAGTWAIDDIVIDGLYSSSGSRAEISLIFGNQSLAGWQLKEIEAKIPDLLREKKQEADNDRALARAGI